MTRHEHQAQRESSPGIPTQGDRDLSLYPPSDQEASYLSVDHNQPGQDAAQIASDQPARSAPREEYQVPMQEGVHRMDAPSVEEEQLSHSEQGSEIISLRGSSLPSSGFPEAPGLAFETELGDLFKDVTGIRLALTHAGRLRAFKKFASKEAQLRDLRMKTDEYRQKALLKRRELRTQLKSFAKVLRENRDSIPETLAPPVAQQSEELEEVLLELEKIEDQLDGPEVAIVKAEWDLSHLMPRLLDSQNTDETLKILVENDYHFPAEDEGGTDSVRSSLSSTEEPSHDAYMISSKLEAVDAIEEKIWRLQDPSIGVSLVSEDFEPSGVPLPAEQLAELQQLRDDWRKATSDLEQSRDLLQSTPEEYEIVRSNSLENILKHGEQSLGASPPTDVGGVYDGFESLRVEDPPPASLAESVKGGATPVENV